MTDEIPIYELLRPAEVLIISRTETQLIYAVNQNGGLFIRAAELL